MEMTNKMPTFLQIIRQTFMRAPRRTSAYERFMKSAELTYVQWHDGEAYDLSALREVSREEMKEIEDFLIVKREVCDWRDVQALARIGSPTAMASLHAATRSKYRVSRLAAGEYLLSINALDDISDLIIEALVNGEFDGLAEANDLAAKYPTPSVRDGLIKNTLAGKNGRGVSSAALLFHIYGHSKEKFDWSKRPFFLKFLTDDPEERLRLFEELCNTLGIDGSKYTKNGE